VEEKEEEEEEEEEEEQEEEEDQDEDIHRRLSARSPHPTTPLPRHPPCA